ncbi:MAG: hypothetical protein QW393_02345 [Candidatus Micrarchaeaceae archaeon]
MPDKLKSGELILEDKHRRKNPLIRKARDAKDFFSSSLKDEFSTEIDI